MSSRAQSALGLLYGLGLLQRDHLKLIRAMADSKDISTGSRSSRMSLEVDLGVN